MIHHTSSYIMRSKKFNRRYFDRFLCPEAFNCAILKNGKSLNNSNFPIIHCYTSTHDKLTLNISFVHFLIILLRKLQEFNKDLAVFNNHICDMDRRLGSIVVQGFDDCSGTEGTFKMITLLGSLLNRSALYSFLLRMKF